MEAETLGHIFEPSFTTKAIGRGTGLGLATVHGIIKQHEGYIEARSQLGQGTSFVIYLPATTEKGTIAGSVLPVGFDRPDPSVNAAILLVEDNLMVREMARDLLESNGFKVLAAESPMQARDIERAYDGTIDLMVSDVIMPGMNGMELYELLQERRPGMPVLYISGYTSDVVIHDDTHGQEAVFLTKPFTAEQLLERVRGGLGKA